MSRSSAIGAALVVVVSVISVAAAWSVVESPDEMEHGPESSALPSDAVRGDSAAASQGSKAPARKRDREHGSGNTARDRAPLSTTAAADISADLVALVQSRALGGNAEGAVRTAVADLELADDALLALLDFHCDIQAGDIPDGVSVLDHTANLARVGARGVVNEKEFYEDDFESHFPAAVEFAEAVDDSNAAVSPATEFAKSTGRIYATFASDGGARDRVLVKWMHLDRKKIHIYSKYAVEPDAGHNYVWFDHPGDWPPGSYAVEVYALSRDLEPLAGGRYAIR